MTRVLEAGRRAPVALLFMAMLAGVPASGQTPVQVREAIRSVESATSYRFLYRDALVAGEYVAIDPGGDPVQSLVRALEGLGLSVQVDAERNQVLVFRSSESRPASAKVAVRGRVLDDATGTSLPFATITWLDDGGALRGVAANESGLFETELPAGTSKQLTVSYLGFLSTSLTVEVHDRPLDVAVRLKARPLTGREVVITGTMLHSDLDTTWHHLVRPGVLAPLGEASVLRSLQTLPSVSITTALSDGLGVRGSKADGFQVLLDGLPIYSQTHMFGLFDAFNEEALQTVAFYYGIAPASYQAPPGGTMSFITREGSRERVSGSFGGSNTSVRGTLEGPIGGGRGSWLVSGRRSYLGQVDWFGNDALIAQGLDVGRSTSLSGSPQEPFEVLSGEADYYDVHAKISLESAGGASLTVSGYSGGDRTTQAAQRRIRLNQAQAGQNANAQSLWGSDAAGLRYQSPVGNAAFLAVVGGVSVYNGEYRNDSVVGVQRRNGQGQSPPILRLESFYNKNTLTQARLAPEVSWGGAGVWTAGADLNVYDTSYREVGGQDRQFVLSGQALQADAFGGYASPRYGPVQYQLGLRSHWYSAGKHLRLSPRAELSVGMDGPVSASIGYSRNHQFLHQLEISPVQESAPDVWILSSEQESPGRVDYITAGLFWRPSSDLAFQGEVYAKEYRNLRLHETANPSRSQSLVDDITIPWLTDVDGQARGLEVMMRHRTGKVLWVHAYALSRTEYENERVLAGRKFPVAWDRTHQYTLTAEVSIGALSANATWSLASGVPNSLSFDNPAEVSRLPAYHRLDLGLSWERRVGPKTITAGLSLYNAYDQDNIWYRTLLPQEVGGPPGERVVESTVGVDVYDLGVHPSFEVGLRF